MAKLSIYSSIQLLFSQNSLLHKFPQSVEASVSLSSSQRGRIVSFLPCAILSDTNVADDASADVVVKLTDLSP